MNDDEIFKMYEAGYSINYIITAHFSSLRNVCGKKNVTKKQAKKDVYSAIYNRLVKGG